LRERWALIIDLIWEHQKERRRGDKLRTNQTSIQGVRHLSLLLE